jgi:hypothetical protein
VALVVMHYAGAWMLLECHCAFNNRACRVWRVRVREGGTRSQAAVGRVCLCAGSVHLRSGAPGSRDRPCARESLSVRQG